MVGSKPSGSDPASCSPMPSAVTRSAASALISPAGMGFSGLALRSRWRSAQSFSAPVATCEPATERTTSRTRETATAPFWVAITSASTADSAVTAAAGAGWTSRIAAGIRKPEGYPLMRDGSGGSRRLVERDLNQRRVRDHRLQVLSVPRRLDDMAHHGSPLVRALDDPSRGGQICLRTALDMEREVRVGVEVGEPAATLAPWRSADVDPAVDDVV